MSFATRKARVRNLLFQDAVNTDVIPNPRKARVRNLLP
jgi:hypothetical protein